MINKENIIPYYHQLSESIRKKIKAGVFKPSDLIPSERELCDTYKVSRSTVRQAMQVLAAEGLIRKEKGVGTRVNINFKLEQNLLGYHNLDLQMKEQGYTASVKVLKHKVENRAGRIHKLMNLTPNDKIFKVTRLRIVNEDPFFLEKIYMPLRRYPHLKVEDFYGTDIFLKKLKDKYNTELGEAKVYIEPVILTQEECLFFGNKGEASIGLLVERISFDIKGKAVAVTKRVFRGDRCRHIFTIRSK